MLYIYIYIYLFNIINHYFNVVNNFVKCLNNKKCYCNVIKFFIYKLFIKRKLIGKLVHLS
jgi:hypothetical protein